jgi:hypothetical protein
MTLAICDNEVRRGGGEGCDEGREGQSSDDRGRRPSRGSPLRAQGQARRQGKTGVLASKAICATSCISPSTASPFISRLGTPPGSTKSKSGSPSWCAHSSVGPVSPSAASGTMGARARQPMHDRHRAQLTRIVGVGTCSEVAHKVSSALRAARPRNFLKDPAAQS